MIAQVYPHYIFLKTTDSEERECKELGVKNPPRDSETREGLYKAIDRVHGEGEPFSPWIKRKDVGVKYANAAAGVAVVLRVAFAHYSYFPGSWKIMRST